MPGPRGARRQGRAAAAHGLQRRAAQHPGELLPAAAVPGGRRAAAAGGQDGALGGAGERGGGGGGNGMGEVTGHVVGNGLGMGHGMGWVTSSLLPPASSLPQIKTWFQNRRMKLKRQLQELRTEPFCSPPLPYGPQSGVVPLPLTYVARPPPLARQGTASGGFTLTALPAPSLDLSSACRAQPLGFWAAPCFVGYRDPRAFLLGV